MSNKSRRRVAMAACAILAGAAIPIAAAGTAWADDTVTQVTPDKTESLDTLEKQGLTSTQAQAVVTAETPVNEGGTATAVEVSHDGKIVVDANQGDTASTDATAKSARNDVSAAIGGGSDSSAIGKDAVAFAEGSSTDNNSIDAKASRADAQASITDSTDSTATATGPHSTATITDSSDTTATARGRAAEAASYDDSSVNVTANGSRSSASSNDNTSSTVSAAGTRAFAYAEGDSDTTATARGTTAYVYAGDISDNASGNGTVTADSTLTANGKGADAEASDDTGVKVTATGTDSKALVYNSTDGSASYTTNGLSSREGYAEIWETTNSSATASGPGSVAEVKGSFDPATSTYVYTNDSSAVATNGTPTTVDTSDTHLVNGVVVPQVEASPLTDVHEMHMMPLP
jgi:hypothetical protein